MTPGRMIHLHTIGGDDVFVSIDRISAIEEQGRRSADQSTAVFLPGATIIVKEPASQISAKIHEALTAASPKKTRQREAAEELDRRINNQAGQLVELATDRNAWRVKAASLMRERDELIAVNQRLKLEAKHNVVAAAARSERDVAVAAARAERDQANRTARAAQQEVDRLKSELELANGAARAASQAAAPALDTLNNRLVAANAAREHACHALHRGQISFASEEALHVLAKPF